MHPLARLKCTQDSTGREHTDHGYIIRVHLGSLHLIKNSKCLSTSVGLSVARDHRAPSNHIPGVHPVKQSPRLIKFSTLGIHVNQRSCQVSVPHHPLLLCINSNPLAELRITYFSACCGNTHQCDLIKRCLNLKHTLKHVHYLLPVSILEVARYHRIPCNDTLFLDCVEQYLCRHDIPTARIHMYQAVQHKLIGHEPKLDSVRLNAAPCSQGIYPGAGLYGVGNGVLVGADVGSNGSIEHFDEQVEGILRVARAEEGTDKDVVGPRGEGRVGA
uniref:Uncharacterized protein n=1 Tax=Triticum urartu TaxID=4572 RepID=A0A8R7TJP5_TRIUA